MAQEEFVVLLGDDAEQEAPSEQESGEFVVLLGGDDDASEVSSSPEEGQISLDLGSDGTISAAADIYQHLAELDITAAKTVKLLANKLSRTDTAFLQVLAYYAKYVKAAGVEVRVKGAEDGFTDVASRLDLERFLAYEG